MNEAVHGNAVRTVGRLGPAGYSTRLVQRRNTGVVARQRLRIQDIDICHIFLHRALACMWFDIAVSLLMILTWSTRKLTPERPHDAEACSMCGRSLASLRCYLGLLSCARPHLARSGMCGFCLCGLDSISSSRLYPSTIHTAVPYTALTVYVDVSVTMKTS